ncbi:hypothetical protein ACRAVF_19170 [Bradyrhizobium oligotrophicum S58]
MTILYRSPDVIIGEHEWHMIVRDINGRVYTMTHWRPLSAKPLAWQQITTWRGRKPDEMQRFRPHAAVAVRSKAARLEAVREREGKCPGQKV